MTTNITEEHCRAFEALTSCQRDNFTLFSCFLDDKPAAAIVAVNEAAPTENGGKPEYVISLLLISIVPGMTITDHEGRKA